MFGVPDERAADDQVMVALEMSGPVAFDPDGFDAFLAERDLGTKWAPRYVRIMGVLPVGAINKIDKTTLCAERWNVADPVYWRRDRRGPLQRMTANDVAELHRRFAEHERGAVVAR